MKKVLSYGGGLDSFAMLLDAIARGELPDVVAFVDVGDGSVDRAGEDPGEWDGTYRHIREIVLPLCAKHGIEFVWIDSAIYPVRDARSLFAWIEKRNQIPTAKGRVCTIIAKVERFEAWLGDRFPGQPVEVWIGFDAAEEDRVEGDPNAGVETVQRRNRFPLVERGLCRCRCVELVRRAGFPVPRKSACVFCPYATKADFRTLARERPETFAKIVELEAKKPPTSNGAKLSIKNFRTIKVGSGKKVPKGAVLSNDGKKHFLPMMLPDYIAARDRSKPKANPCHVCGAREKATKATACGYLDEEDGPTMDAAAE